MFLLEAWKGELTDLMQSALVLQYIRPVGNFSLGPGIYAITITSHSFNSMEGSLMFSLLLVLFLIVLTGFSFYLLTGRMWR